MPVEVHDALLKPEEVVDGADDEVDGGGVTRLGAQVVLPLCSTGRPVRWSVCGPKRWYETQLRGFSLKTGPEPRIKHIRIHCICPTCKAT